jgi:AraC-like DNA-binding protein
MLVNSIDIIAIITAFQLILLGIILLSRKQGKKISHYLLSSFMFANALLIINFLNYRLQFITPLKYFFAFTFFQHCYALLVPLLFLYINSICYKTFRLQRRDVWHLLPYFLLVTWSFISDIYSNHALKVFFEFLLHVQIASYSAIILITLYRYRRALKAMYSSIEKVDLTWLVFLFLGFIIMWFMDFSHFMLRFLHITIPQLEHVLSLSSLTINLLFATGIVYCGLKQLAIFSGIEEKPRYATSPLRPQDFENYSQRLMQYMEKDKPYLDPDLSLDELASKLSILPRYLSQVINQSTNQNFFEYINRYRINEFKKQITYAKDSKITILEALYNVGFNSKSTFNEAFKKNTGITPSEFIRQQRTNQFN